MRWGNPSGRSSRESRVCSSERLIKWSSHRLESDRVVRKSIVGTKQSPTLRNVSVEGEQGKPNIEFTADGVLKAAELKIMNLRPGVSKQLVWEEVRKATTLTRMIFVFPVLIKHAISTT